MLAPIVSGEGIVYTFGNKGDSYSFVLLVPFVYWYRYCERSEYVTVHTPTGGCSREYSTMGESLIERRRVVDEVLRDVKTFYG